MLKEKELEEKEKEEKKIEEFICDFSIEKLKRILRQKNRNFNIYEKRLGDYEQDIFKEIYQVGNVELENYTKFGVFTIETSKELSERSSKKKQFELAKQILKNEFFDAGFFVFYDEAKNFRFSFVHSIYKGTRREFSYYKRYTYFVEKGKPSHTFGKALYELKLSKIEDILSVFEVQPLIKEFYTEIQNWYAWALKDDRVCFP
ncbi:MAG: hypothetical protein ACK4Y7_05920, partial [Caldimicrobium sp.]